MLARFIEDDSGATAMEYGLMMALIAVVLVGALTTLGTKISTVLFANVSNTISSN